MNIVKIEDVRKGDVFKLLTKADVLTLDDENGNKVHHVAFLAIERVNKKPVYLAQGYNRSIRKYEGSKWADINAYTEKKKGTLVLIDFDF